MPRLWSQFFDFEVHKCACTRPHAWLQFGTGIFLLCFSQVGFENSAPHLAWAKFWGRSRVKTGNQDFADEPKNARKLLRALWTNSNFLVSRRIEHCCVINYVNVLLTWEHHPHVHSLWANGTTWQKPTKSEALNSDWYTIRQRVSCRTLAGMMLAEIKWDHRDVSITIILNPTHEQIMIISIDMVLT